MVNTPFVVLFYACFYHTTCNSFPTVLLDRKSIEYCESLYGLHVRAQAELTYTWADE